MRGHLNDIILMMSYFSSLSLPDYNVLKEAFVFLSLQGNIEISME